MSVNFPSTVQHTFAYFHVILWYVTSTSEMALICSVNPGHGTAACLHYTWNDICVQMTQVYHFTVVASVEASSPLKVLSFINHNELYLSWTLFYVNWIYNEWCWALFDVNFMKLYYCESWMTLEWMWNDLNGTSINSSKIEIIFQLSSVINLLPSNPAQRLPWYSVELTSARMHIQLQYTSFFALCSAFFCSLITCFHSFLFDLLSSFFLLGPVYASSNLISFSWPSALCRYRLLHHQIAPLVLSVKQMLACVTNVALAYVVFAICGIT